MTTPIEATTVDLRYVDGIIRDQGSLGSCQAFATTTIVDTIMRQAGHELPLLSPLAYYAAIRNEQHTFNTDSGTYKIGGILASTKDGFATEASWGYDENNLFVQPPQSVVEEASHIKVTSWNTIAIEQSYTSLERTIKEYLQQGKPVMMVFRPQGAFYNADGPLADQNNLSHDNYKDGHAVEIIGVDDTLNGGSYIIHNSWGHSYGDNGYSAISYKQFVPQSSSDEMIGLSTINGMNINGHIYDFQYTAAKTVVSEYYACILERAPEITGLEFWANKNLAHADLANLLINSTEGQQMYGKLSNTDFVENMYENVLGRHSDQAGLDYFVGFLNNGQSRGQVISGMMDYLFANSADAVSHQYLVNKVNVANYIAIATHYEGGADQVTHNILEQVTADINHTEILKVGIPDLIHVPIVV